MMFFLVCHSGIVLSQGCKEQVLQSLAYMRKYDATMSLHIKYSIKTTFARPDSVQESSVEIFAAGNQFKMLGDNISIYQNEKYNLTFINDRKLIFITNAKQQQLMPWETIGMLQDSLVRQSAVLKCERNCINEKSNSELDHISLKMAKSGKFALDIDKMEYWIDPVSSEVRRFRIIYSNHETFDNILVSIDSYDRDYKLKIFDVGITKSLEDPDQIKILFKGYSIRDNR